MKLNLILLMVMAALCAGCRNGKSASQQVSTLTQPATADLVDKSIAESNSGMDASLAGYLPNKNEIDEPVMADTFPDPASYRGGSSRSNSGSGCQDACCR
jgi:hypothetical protein